MEIEILNFLDDLKEKISIDFCVFNLDGECIYGNYNGGRIKKEGEGIFCDHKNGRTIFSFRLKNKEYICLLKGAGETEKNYATLLIELAKKTFFKEANYSKDEFLRALLFGELSEAQVSFNARKYSIKEKEACAMIITYPLGRANDVIDTLKAYSFSQGDFVVKLDSTACAYVKFADQTFNEYHSYTEFAEFLCHSALQELGLSIHVSIGAPVKSVTDISLSFSQASATEKLVAQEGSKGNVHSFKEYVLFKILEDVPKYKLNGYVNFLVNKDAKAIFDDKEMTETAEEFLSNNLNASETSRKLFLHRNTLTYRLDKIEKLTGLDIRKFSDAVTFRLLTILFKLAD